MGFSSFACLRAFSRSVCFLAGLVFAIGIPHSLAPLANAETPASDIPLAAPTSRPDAAEAKVERDSKKLKKYDIDRIGRRDVGHGFNVYSAQREQELGQRLAAGFERHTKVITDPALNEYINRVGQKIVRNSDAEVPFTIKVIDSGDIPRAWGLPGGFLYVDTALILAADSEAELAGVMAHEIAHVAARHATRALTRKYVCSVVNSVAFLAGPAGIALQNGSGLAGPLSVKKFSRDAENEADLLGMEYAYIAGYDPEAFLVALEKLHAIEQNRKALFSKVPGYNLGNKIPFHKAIARSFASYPVTEERMQRLQEEMSAFLPDRSNYVIDTNDFQEIKARLMEAQGPTLRRLPPDANPQAPVLRRTAEFTPNTELAGETVMRVRSLRGAESAPITSVP